MICAVYHKWLDNGEWSPTLTSYINIKDGDLKRAAKVIRKRFGKLVGPYNLEDNEIDFKTDDGEVLYWICIKPIQIEEI